jgi:hypothetical protein
MRFADSHPRTVRAAALCAAAALAAAIAGCGRGGESPRFDVAVLAMRTARANDDPAPPSARAGRPILFLVEIPGHLSEARLEARIVDARGEIVWTGVGLQRDRRSGSGPLLLPEGFLPKGEYRLALGRAEPGVQRVDFPFRVE